MNMDITIEDLKKTLADVPGTRDPKNMHLDNVLKYHIHIERLINKILDSHFPGSDRDISIGEYLNFFKKVKVLDDLRIFESKKVTNSLRALNSIRNRFAHPNDSCHLTQEDVDNLERGFQVKGKKLSTLYKERLSKIEALTLDSPSSKSILEVTDQDTLVLWTFNHILDVLIEHVLEKKIKELEKSKQFRKFNDTTAP